MRTSVLLCVLLVAVLAVASFAGPSTSAVRPDGGTGWEPVIRTGGCGLTAAERANLDPRLSNRGESGAEPRVQRDPPCELVCNACWLRENEGPTADEYVDTFNGGCNSNPEVFWSVSPAYGPVTICGQGGNYMYSGSTYRDTDWYELTLTETREITATCTAEFPVTLFIIDGNSGCSNIITVANDSQPECIEASVTYVCTPGTWWIWVGAAEFSGWPNDADYVLTIHGYDFQCVLDCPGGVAVEGEPALETDYEDHTNGGCNSDPPVFQRLDPSPTTDLHCGIGGSYEYFGTCYRDTDWYELVLDEAREVTVCAAAEFPLQMMFLHPDPDCGSFMYGQLASPDVCDEGCITEVLQPGVHWLFIAPQFGPYVHPEARYVFSVDGYTTAVENRSWGLIKSLYKE